MRRVLPALIASLVAGFARADEPAPTTTYRLVSPRPVGVIATGLNARGDLVGFQWAEERARPGVLEQVPIYARGKDVIRLPLLAGFTATSPAAVSDQGMVVGRVSRANVSGKNNEAFVWDEDHGIRGLGTLPGDKASLATGVSRDGGRVSGLSIGRDRVRACVWDRASGWKGTPILQEGRTLGSQVVPISGDGRWVAAVDGTVPCRWSIGADGSWSREVLGPAGALVPRAVNNAGTVVGLAIGEKGLPRAVAWTAETGCQRLELPEGYVRSEALAINNAGAIVGMVDGPGGSEVGSNAFVREEGRVRILKECGPRFSSATAINDRGQVAGVLEDNDDEDAPDAAARPFP